MELNPEQTYVVIDIETTGNNIPDGKIIEIAALKIRDGEHIGTFNSLINPGEKLSWFITRLTGITDTMLEKAPYFKDVAIDFVNFIQGAPIVAHNASFDYRFIKHALENAIGNYKMENEKLCTISLARKKFPELSKYNLDFLTETFNLNNPKRHRAYGDASVTAEFFVKHLL
jgi:DNA polymerase-3 subunit epsilon